MSNVLTIKMLKRLDVANIDAAIAAPETLNINLYQEYDGGLSISDVVDVNSMDASTLAAFKTVIDYLSNAFEAGSPVFKIGYDAVSYEFDFSGSYLRDAVSTDVPTAMTAGQQLDVRFEFPSFSTGEAVDVTFIYGTGFTGSHKSLLANAGVSVASSSTTFRVTGSERECKITFSKPSAEVGNYVIESEQLQYIIPRL